MIYDGAVGRGNAERCFNLTRVLGVFMGFLVLTDFARAELIFLMGSEPSRCEAIFFR